MTTDLLNIADQFYGSSNEGLSLNNDDPKNNSYSKEENSKTSNSNHARKKQKEVAKHECAAYKYSGRGKGSLHEAIILARQSAFLKYENGKIEVVDKIEETSRIIRSPIAEEYPYEPYEFTNMEEVNSCLKRSSQESLDSLFQKATFIVKQYNDQDNDIITLLAADTVWTYFQDRFSTTHYVGVVGDNGSGKSTAGDTFEAVGYRVVNMTDPTAANIFRVLGKVEYGQCTIVADEAEKIDKSFDIMSVLKTGYHIKGKVARMNMTNETQQFFYTYCFKMIIAERSPNQSNAKGVLDRTFMFTSYKGKPQYDIKEVLNPAGDVGRQMLLQELMDFRKSMLIYRLKHFKDPIPDIDTGLEGRDKELSKPLLQLFSNTKSYKEIRAALQTFLNAKNQRKGNLIEAALHPIIVNLISIYGKEISAGLIWKSITETIDGSSDEKRPNEYQSSDYGMLYRNTITNIICDKFGAERKHNKHGSMLTFDSDKLVKVGKAYNLETVIQTKMEGDGGDGSDGSTDSGMISDLKYSKENGITDVDSNKNNVNSIQNYANIITPKNGKDALDSLQPSQLSQPSPEDADTIDICKTIYRLGHTDTFACKNCKQRGDRWFMQIHNCIVSK
jgi:hypothetical protein